MDSATDWITFKEDTLEATRLIVGARRWSGRSSVLAETLGIISRSRAARLAGDNRRHIKLVKRCGVQIQVEKLAREAEKVLNISTLRPAFGAIK